MPDQPRKELSSKQIAFIERYLVHWNGALAAREAGYGVKAARSMACQLLKDPMIRSYADERLAELLMETDEVHKRLGDKGRASMAKFLTLKSRDYPLWSPKARYQRGDIVEVDNQAYKAIAQSGPTWKQSVRDRAKDKDRDNPDETDGIEAVDPAKDGLGIYWQKVPREKYVEINEEALVGDDAHMVVKFGRNKYGQPEIELCDSKSSLVDVGRKHKMFTDKIEAGSGRGAKPLPNAKKIAADTLARLRRESDNNE